MVAKMILPFLGGSPAVWNTCLFFFQTVLLLGYLYAHFGSMWLGLKRHMMLHLAILGAALYFLPVAIPAVWLERPDANPGHQVLWVLLVSVGFPFFVLSANAPLLQKWFSTTGHAAARDPYFLYAASNAGSLIGLLAYPFWLEPRLSLGEQASFWLYVYLAFLAIVLGCSFAVRGGAVSVADDTTATEALDSIKSSGEKLGLFRRIRWIILSFAPSSLLLGVTTYVTTDLASVPLLWVLPLSLYLISFIVAYQRNSWASHPFVVRRQAFLLLAAAITFFATATEPAVILLPMHLLAFFVTCLVCHGELAKDRPETIHLTEYYLWISFGGVLGGFFNGFLAPIIFNSVQEYPLAMIAAALMRPRLGHDHRASYWRDFLWAGGLFIVILSVVLWAELGDFLSGRVAHVMIFGLAGLIGLSFSQRPLRFALGIGAIMLATGWYQGPFGQVLFSERSFFGVYRAVHDDKRNLNVIFHGTTLHGAQAIGPKMERLQPLSYYHDNGPAGHAFKTFGANGYDKPVAIVGLGAGALACYGRREQDFVFYEIDLLVERIARNRALFTYLQDCPPRVSVEIGDARVALARARDGTYGMFVLDAFSGDAIPIHLLTREAVELYLSKLLPDGVLLFHISNRYLDLVPVVDRLAAEFKLAALLRHDSKVSELERAEGKQPSTWVVMARERSRLGSLARDARWRPLTGDRNGDLWTDNYSNVLKVLRW